MRKIITSFQSICMIARGEILQWRNDARVWMVFLIELVFVIRCIGGYTVYGLLNGTKSTAWIMSALFADATGNNGVIKILIYMGCIVLFCNAPFVNSFTPFVVIRGKKKNWIFGEILYVFLASFLYMTFFAVTSFIVILPSASFSEIWGGTVYFFDNERLNEEMELTRALYLYGCELDASVISRVYPLAAFVYTFFVGWISFSIIGMLMLAVNMLTHSKNIGVILATVLVLMDPVVYNFCKGVRAYQSLLLFSPVSWSSIEQIRLVSEKGYLTISYIVVTSIIILIVFTILTYRSSRKYEMKI